MNTRTTDNVMLLGVMLLSLLLAAAPVRAATLDQLFANDFDATGIYLWSMDPANMTFTSASFGANMNGWTVQSNTGDKLVMSGPSVAPGAGRFNVLMSYLSRPFQMEWAEVYFNNAVTTVRGVGTLTYGLSGWSNVDAFTHMAEFTVPAPATIATPVPASIVTMLSALALVSFTQTRRRAAAA